MKMNWRLHRTWGRIHGALRPARPARARLTESSLTDRVAGFGRDEDGSLIIFGLMIMVLMLIIGGLGLDIERFETARTRLQNTADGAALHAASLTQEVDSEVLVYDYFNKAGVGSFIDDVRVSEAMNYKHVEVDADINVPTHWFNMLGIENLGTVVGSVAEESIGDVEISLVLDVSGSMGSNNKLWNLKNAAHDFVDAIYENTGDGSVSTSIVPYSTQVSAGPEILKYYNRTPISHETSHCLNFEDADFTDPAISTVDPVEQTLHFDPWTSNNFDPNDWRDREDFNMVCHDDGWRNILPYSQNTSQLKNYVSSLMSEGWTSIELGVKWGTAMLDPSFRPVVSGLIDESAVDGDFTGRPLAYNQADGLKVLVVMTDGENTEQYEMEDPYRSGASFVYAWRDEPDYYGNRDIFYSIWDGEGEPDPTAQTQTHMVETTERVCTRWSSWWGYTWCANYEYQTTYEEVEVEVLNWYVANGPEKGWRSTPYGGDDAWRLTWDQLWKDLPVRVFTDRYLSEMGGMGAERTAINNARHYIGTNEKNARTLDICAAAKSRDVYVYTIGFEAPWQAENLLEACATTPSHFFDVDGTEISQAFSAIAADINRLRLVQ